MIFSLINGLLILKSFRRENIWKISHYDKFGYMLLPDIDTAPSIFTTSYIKVWTKLMRDGPMKYILAMNSIISAPEGRYLNPLRTIVYVFWII